MGPEPSSDLSCCPLTEAANSGAQSPADPCPLPHRLVHKRFTKHFLCSPCREVYHREPPRRPLSDTARPVCRTRGAGLCAGPSLCVDAAKPPLALHTRRAALGDRPLQCPLPRPETSCVRRAGDPRVWLHGLSCHLRSRRQHSGAGSPRWDACPPEGGASGSSRQSPALPARSVSFPYT